MTDHLFDRLRPFREGGGNRRSGSPPNPERSRIKRALFGPVDHEANRRFVEQELAKSQREMTARYNFDFTNDRPLPNGRWEWERMGAPSTTSALVNSDQVVPEAASTNKNVSETEKENSGVLNSSPASNMLAAAGAVVSTSPTSSSATTTTTASTSIPVIPSSAAASGSSAANSSSPCDIPASAVSAAAAANTSSCRSSSAKPICQKSSTSSARHQNKKITDIFPQRKRSKSKVKTQERKPESEQRELSQPPTLSAATTAAATKAE